MYPEIMLPDTGGVMASIAVKGRSKGGVSSTESKKPSVEVSRRGKIASEKIIDRGNKRLIEQEFVVD